MTDSIWRLVEADEVHTAALGTALGLPLPVARLLVARGLTEPVAAGKFLRARLSDLTEPELLPNLPAAVEHLAQALESRGKIVVFGDYDADGLTSTALLVRVLRQLGGEVAAFIPHRLEDGYGLTTSALAKCIEQHQPQLIITVDCGTCSPDALRGSSVPIIVTDHHDPVGELSPGLAVVNPKLGEDSVLRHLAGVGVTFKLCHALLKKLRKSQARTSVDLKDYLDLVAIGTVADVVPLTGENRILVRHGLLRLAQTKNIGLAALKAVAGLAESPDAWHLGFVIGPRLNAVGRLGNAQEVLELLLTDKPDRALELARQLDEANRQRQAIEKNIAGEAMREIDATFDPARSFGLVVASTQWHPGVVGIVAARLVQRYRRPAIVLAQEADGLCRGSCRSLEEFPLVGHLAKCADLLTRYGGHNLAAGVTLEQKNLIAFRQRFNEVAHAALAKVDLRPVQRIDGWLSLREANDDLFDAMAQLRPFGQQHPDPVWAARSVRVLGAPRRMAKDTLGLTLEADNVQLRAIGFSMGQREVPAGPLDIAFHLRRETWQGQTQLQLHLCDFRPATLVPR